MSYLLPMPPFDWQASQWDNFIHNVNNNHLSHAFLLAGQEGIGVDALATAMGQYLLCQAPNQSISCGKCKSCLLLKSNTHPDFLKIEIGESSKQIKIDQIRQVSEFINKTAQQGGAKVVLLSPAESMNLNAANALLKNLEEPAGHSFFFLVSQQPHLLLPTIKSRCSFIDLPVPDKALSLKWLDGLGVEGGEDLLIEAGGAPLLIQQWLEDGTLQERHKLIKELSDVTNGVVPPMGLAGKWSKQDPLLVVQIMLSILESVIATAMAGKPTATKYMEISQVMANKSPALLFRLRDRVCEKKAQLSGSFNLNAALVVEELLLDWHSIAMSRGGA